MKLPEVPALDHAISLVEDQEVEPPEVHEVFVALLVHELPQPPRGRDDDLGPAPQQTLLLLEAHPAHDRHDVDVSVLRDRIEHVAHLHGEFTGGCEDQRSQRAAFPVEFHTRVSAGFSALVEDQREWGVVIRLLLGTLGTLVRITVTPTALALLDRLGFRIRRRLVRLFVPLREDPVEDRQPERQRFPAPGLRRADDVAPAFDGGIQAIVLDRRRVGELHVLQRAEQRGVEVELEPVGDVGASVEVHSVHHRAHAGSRVIVVVHLPPGILGVALGLGGERRGFAGVLRCGVLSLVLGVVIVGCIVGFVGEVSLFRVLVGVS